LEKRHLTEKFSKWPQYTIVTDRQTDRQTTVRQHKANRFGPNWTNPAAPFCGNTVVADLVCRNISLADSDALNVTSNQAVKVTGAVVPDLYDQLILTAEVIDRLSRCDASVN